MALRANDILFAARKALGLPYWSLSAFLKHKVKNAVEYISRFEEIVAREAGLRGVDGVVCGHIHHAGNPRRIGGVLYLNDGDWVESCVRTAEDAQGNMEILRWPRSFTAMLWKGRSHLGPASGLRLPQGVKPKPYPRRAKRLEAGPIPGVAAQLKILIVTDAWMPQVNGVVRTLEILGKDLAALGLHGALHHAAGPAHLSRCPPILKSASLCFSAKLLTREIRDFAPDAVHIAAEGLTAPLTAQRICVKHGIAFTTAFHTASPNMSMPVSAWCRKKSLSGVGCAGFNHPATAVMVATNTLKHENSRATETPII